MDDGCFSAHGRRRDQRHLELPPQSRHWDEELEGCMAHSTPRLIWINFVQLFMVSLVPFSTAWVADAHFEKAPVFVYAAVFVLVNLAYIPFEWHALSAAPIEEISLRSRRFAKVRSGATLGTFVLAMLVSLQSPYWGFGLVCCALLSTCGQSYRGLCKRQMYRF